MRFDTPQSNRLIGWCSAAIGAGTGLIMGLWSFDGPVAVPETLGDYGDTSRRLARLGHIAFFGLAILNLLLAHELERAKMSDRFSRWASRCMNFGNVFLPLTLFMAAAWHPLKYLMPIPAMCVGIAMCLVAFTQVRSGNASS